MLHVLIINPMVVTCTGPACRLIQVAMCAESSECKNLQHDYCGSICMLLVWVTMQQCKLCMAVQNTDRLSTCCGIGSMQCPYMLVQACQQCIFFQYLDDEYDCRILISRIKGL